MVLSDGEIRTALGDGRIIIEPALPGDYLDVVAPQGLASPVVIDPTQPGVIPDLIKKWARRHPSEDSYYDLPSGQFALGVTFETVTLPAVGRLAARVEGKSTLARLGFVVHMTAPTIHSGFGGKIVLEMYNFGPYTIRLAHRMRVCQLVFEEMSSAPTGQQSTQYQGQRGVRGSTP